MKLRETLAALKASWRRHRLTIARDHLTRLLRETPRHWSAAQVFGGAQMRLGCVTEAEALIVIQRAGYEILYIDVDAAVILLRDAVPALSDQSR